MTGLDRLELTFYQAAWDLELESLTQALKEVLPDGQ